MKKSYLILQIIYTFIFLISSTYIWFFGKENNIYQKVSTNIFMDPIEFTSLANESSMYQFTIENKETTKQKVTISIVPNLLQNNISNNYIKYQLNGDSIRSLNMDGIIYINSLESLEKKDIELKLWISDSYTGPLNYNGRIIVS